MSVEASLARLNEIAMALPRPGCTWEQRPTFGPPATPQSVAEFQQLAGFALPADIRAFLAQTNAIVATTIHNGYWLGDIEQLTKSAHRGDFPTFVEGEPAVPIATDGAGNGFLLGISGCVWRWNHETGNMQQIATSFGTFLERVADDWSAHISDDPAWQFLV